MSAPQIVIWSFIVCAVIWTPFMVYGLMRLTALPPAPPPFDVWMKMSEQERQDYINTLDRWRS